MTEKIIQKIQIHIMLINYPNDFDVQSGLILLTHPFVNNFRLTKCILGLGLIRFFVRIRLCLPEYCRKDTRNNSVD